MSIKIIIDWLILQKRKEYRGWLLLIFLIFTLLLVISVIDLSSYLLIGTGLAVFWYSIETYYLKQVQQKTLFQQRAKDNYDLMPFLVFDISYASERFFTIYNKGKGLAKNIEFTIKFDNKSYQKKNIVILPNDEFKFSHLNDHKFLSDFGSMDKSAIKTIKIYGEYKDIANRNYVFKMIIKTDGTYFEIIENDQKPNDWKIGDGL